MASYLAQHYLDNAVKAYPEKIAVSCGNSSLSYKALSLSSNRLANCLIKNGLIRQDRIIFCLKRSTDCIVAIFGILKADAIYVPIDTKSPLQRMKTIIDDCKPAAIICDSTTINTIIEVLKNNSFKIPVIINSFKEDLPHKASGISSFPLICRKQLEQYDILKPIYKNIDTDTAYILYTSGSTGNPKGVMISHINITNYINWAVDCFDISAKDRLLNTAPFHFDMSTFEIYCAAKSFATLCIAQEGHLLFPNKLINLIEEEKISIWKAISSLIMYLAKTGALEADRIPSLKKVLFGGETLPTRYLIEWMQIYPEKSFFNVYGPSETTGISTYFHVKDIPDNANVSIPIGQACANSEVYLLKKDNSPAETGTIGMLHIRGSALSKGYWNDSEKTKSAFITNPLTKIPGDWIYRTQDLARLRKDGMYEFIGRQDSQIKHMGYRIELYEIEKALLSIKKVNDAAVITVKSGLLDITEITAFVETQDNLSVESLMSRLKNTLPRYMLPHNIFPVSKIPRTNRGKIDRKILRENYLRSN